MEWIFSCAVALAIGQGFNFGDDANKALPSTDQQDQQMCHLNWADLTTITRVSRIRLPSVPRGSKPSLFVQLDSSSDHLSSAEFSSQRGDGSCRRTPECVFLKHKYVQRSPRQANSVTEQRECVLMSSYSIVNVLRYSRHRCGRKR